jgi:hypothetical protein
MIQRDEEKEGKGVCAEKKLTIIMECERNGKGKSYKKWKTT